MSFFNQRKPFSHLCLVFCHHCAHKSLQSYLQSGLKALSQHSQPGAPQHFHANAPNSSRAGERSAGLTAYRVLLCHVMVEFQGSFESAQAELVFSTFWGFFVAESFTARLRISYQGFESLIGDFRSLPRLLRVSSSGL